MKNVQVVAHEGLSLTTTTNEARIDSRLLTKHLGNQHHNTMALINKHEGAFQNFGKVLFKTEPLTDSRTGQKERFALLNEEQAYFLLSLSRNTDTVVNLKVKLIQSFGEYRRAVARYQQEYLPSFHVLQDAIHLRAAESSNEKMVHVNVAKAVNTTVGIEPGGRSTASAQTQAWLTFAQDVAARAMLRGHDHHDGFQYVKRALQAVKECIALECLDSQRQNARKIGKEVAHAHANL
jgi:phage regulator Rha-like protein